MNGYKAVVSDDPIQSNANIITYNGSTTFAQSNDVVSKTAYNGTVSGNVTIGSDGDGSKIDFVGTGSGKITCSVVPNISTANSFSFGIRIKTGSNVSTTQVIFHNTISGTNLTTLIIGTGEIRVGLYNGSYFTKKSISCVANTLYDIFCYYDGSVVYLYVNGVEAVGINTPIGGVSAGLHIGSRQANNDLFFTGSIYYIRFYSTVLTDAQRTAELALGQKQTALKDCVLEILPDYFALPAAPTVVYDSVGNNNGTATTIDITDNSFFFSGASDVINLPTNLGISNGNSFSVSFFVDPTSIGVSRTQNIFNARPSVSRGIGFRILGNASAIPTIEFAMRNDAGQSTISLPYSSGYLNTRNHIIGTYNNGTNTMTLYHQGVSIGTTLGRVVPVPIDTTLGGNFAFGGSIDWLSNCNIGNVSIYNRALTPSEVTQIYNAGRNVITPVTSGLIAEYRPSPTTIYDVKAFTPATPIVISTSFQLDADGVNTYDSNPLIMIPWKYLHIRNTTNNITIRYDNSGSMSSEYTLGSGDRNWHNVVATFAPLNGSFITSIFIDGIKVDTDTHTLIPSTTIGTLITLGKYGTPSFFNGKISNTKIYIGTITDAEGVSMSNGNPIVPANATLLTYPKRPTPYTTTLTDITGNGYDFTITP